MAPGRRARLTTLFELFPGVGPGCLEKAVADGPVARRHRRQKGFRNQTADADDDLAWSLVLDHLVFTAEAEVRWLDHVESRLARHTHGPASARRTATEHDDTQEARR